VKGVDQADPLFDAALLYSFFNIGGHIYHFDLLSGIEFYHDLAIND